MRYPYTRKNLTEAAKVVAERAGVERRSSDAMLDLANMGLPEFLKFVAQEFFVWGEEPFPHARPSGPTLTAVTMVRRALKQLSRDGAFKFEDEPTEEVVRTSGSFL